MMMTIGRKSHNLIEARYKESSCSSFVVIAWLAGIMRFFSPVNRSLWNKNRQNLSINANFWRLFVHTKQKEVIGIRSRMQKEEGTVISNLDSKMQKFSARESQFSNRLGKKLNITVCSWSSNKIFNNWWCKMRDNMSEPWSSVFGQQNEKKNQQKEKTISNRLARDETLLCNCEVWLKFWTIDDLKWVQEIILK